MQDSEAGLRRLDHGPRPGTGARVCLYSCVRNEIARLPYFLAYHRELGVERFVFLDNDSTDGTAEYLLEQQDCAVFWTDAAYSSSFYGVRWLNQLLNDHADGQWALVVDADELLVYPQCERLSLHALVDYLETSGADALLTFLLDMYAAGPIRKAHYDPGRPFLEVCPYFDTDSYDFGKWGLHAGVPVRGGPRRRLFWAHDGHRGNPPVLAKLPLVRWRRGLAYEASTHQISGVTTAPVTGALLHFKLFADLYENACEEARRQEHWDGGAQYEAYWSVLRRNPELDPIYDGSARYSDSRQLVELGLMHMPESFPGC